jgi:hypothetical protein
MRGYWMSERGAITACVDLRRPRNPAAPPVCLPPPRAAPTQPNPSSQHQRRRSPSAFEAPSSKTLAMQKQTGKSGGSGGGTPAKRGRPFGSTTGPGAVTAAAAAVGDLVAPATLVGPSLQVLLALSGNMFVSFFLQFR